MIEGASEETATAAAASAGGDLDRARLLVSDPEVIDRRRFWMEAPTRLDGTGARAAALVSEAMTRLDEVLGPLEEAQRRESLALVEQLDRIGAKKTATKELEARHNRERRRIRVDELHAGLAALVDGYRGEPFDAARFLTASSLVGKFVENLVFNPNEELALQGLFVALPRR
jgi:DNA polymerase-3 subunit delta'